MPPPLRPGTALRCSCHGQQVMAVSRPDLQAVIVQDRRHGTDHILRLGAEHLAQLVRTLDPLGTTATLIGRVG